MLKTRIITAILLLVGILLAFFVYTSQASDSRFPFRFGLDLSGGALLTYRADVSNLTPADIPDALDTLRDVIERRVNLFGVAEPRVSIEQSSAVSGSTEERLLVELPGVADTQEAIDQIGQTPLLEFRLARTDVPALHTLSEEELAEITFDDLFESTGLTGQFLKSASIQFGGGHTAGLSNNPTVVIEFDNEGEELFAQITRDHVGEVLAIFLDGIPISQPVIQTQITGGSAVITGDFNPEEARDLARNLNFGALPVPIELIGTQTVGASLGADVLSAGIRAGLWGLGLVALFLIAWYRLPGLVATISLAVYVVLMLALFKLIPVTLTAAGIAGFILSIGMAVDANVLIFERLKEELREGKNLSEGIRTGFARAWASIRDGNLSSLITAIILFWFGSSLIEGFALTFGIGVLISMITAVTLSRLLLLSLASIGEKATWIFRCGLSKK